MIKIIPIEYGKSVLSEDKIFEGGRSDKFRPIVFKVYLIQSCNRLIMVDAGCETMPGFVMKDFIGTIKALERFGIRASQITDVIITHAHHDHIECVKYFTQATVYIQEEEYEIGNGYLTACKNVCRFKETVVVCDGVEVIKIGGHTKGSCIVRIKSYDKDKIIVGDECYLRESIYKKIPIGTSYCPKKSRDFIETYSNNNFELLFCHDI
ncbi:MAG: MBL fold metallo-hydrolase [Ruminococcus sp.]